MLRNQKVIFIEKEIIKKSSNHENQRPREEGIAMSLLVLLWQILVTKQDSIWKYTGCLSCNYTVSQAIRTAFYFYLSHKTQVMISHDKTVT